MKKHFAVYILTFLLFMAMGSVPCFGAELPSYVALGDSISTGNGLPDYVKAPGPYAKDSFVNIFANDAGLAVTNLAVDGRASKGLAKSLVKPSEQTKAAVAGADVITITIGGNDLLNAFYLKLGEAMNIDMSKAGYKTKIIEKITKGMITNDAQTKAAVSQAASAFSGSITTLRSTFGKNLGTGIAAIKKLNPECGIIMQTIPNPYGKLSFGRELDKAFGDAVNAFNAEIFNQKSSLGYGVADTFTAFSNSSEILTNAGNTNMPLNPHPNKQGHYVIAKEVEKLYAESSAMRKDDWPDGFYAYFITLTDTMPLTDSAAFNEASFTSESISIMVQA